MKEIKYFVLSKDLGPIEYTASLNSDNHLTALSSPSFVAVTIGDGATWEFTFKYKSEPKARKIKLNWCQIDDIRMLAKILGDVEPGWNTESEETVVKAEKVI